MKKLKSVLEDYKLLLKSIPWWVTTLFVMAVVFMNLFANKVMFRVLRVRVSTLLFVVGGTQFSVKQLPRTRKLDGRLGVESVGNRPGRSKEEGV